MPVIKSAIKKLRQDRKKEQVNDKLRDILATAIKKAKKDKTSASVSAAFSVIDKATKNKILHRNKAARIKSQISKGVSTSAKPKKPEAQVKVVSKAKKAPKKTSAKK